MSSPPCSTPSETESVRATEEPAVTVEAAPEDETLLGCELSDPAPVYNAEDALAFADRSPFLTYYAGVASDLLAAYGGTCGTSVWEEGFGVIGHPYGCSFDTADGNGGTYTLTVSGTMKLASDCQTWEPAFASYQNFSIRLDHVDKYYTWTTLDSFDAHGETSMSRTEDDVRVCDQDLWYRIQFDGDPAPYSQVERNTLSSFEDPYYEGGYGYRRVISSPDGGALTGDACFELSISYDEQACPDYLWSSVTVQGAVDIEAETEECGACTTPSVYGEEQAADCF